MNIGFVVHHFEASDGTGGYAVELVRRLAQEHAVTLYAAAVRAPVPAGVTVVRVPAVGGSAYARILSFPLAFAAVRRKHDVVHAQGWVTTAADVVTTHIVLAAWRDAAARAGVVSPPGERFLGGFVAAREASLVRSDASVIAPSRRAAQDVERFYARPGARVVYHGFPVVTPIESRTDARRQLGLPAEGFIALYAGDPRKGFDVAARAIANTPDIRLLVASRSRPELYLSRARELDIGSRIHWLGGLHEMRAVYSSADVLLHPTIYDTFGMVVAEAMAYGVPVIASREAGISELLTHGESALLTSVDVSEVTSALRNVRDDPALAARVAEGGKRVAASRTWDDSAAETFRVYQERAF